MIKTRTHHGHHGLTAQKNNLLVPSLSFKHLAVRGVLFCFHSCAPKREQRATFFTSSSLSRHLLFLSKSSFRMRGGSDTTQHNKVIGREALFALGLKRWGKEVAKAMCKTFNKVDKNTRKIGLFEDSFFKTLGFGLWHSVFVAVNFVSRFEVQ